jgi:DNA-binding transcriptional regulator YdaS (Cro superfamily)
MKTRTGPLDLAISVAGSMTALAEQLGITPQAVARWRNVPAGRCLEVERLTGISRHHLRPDIYGPEPKRRPLRRARKPEPRVAA